MMMLKNIALAASLAATNAHACSGKDEAEVSNGVFHIGYSSWVEAPEPDEQFFRYARCIRSLNGRWVKANWKLAGLKGIAHPKIPLSAEYSFLTARTTLAQGELKYGRKEPFKYKTSANFLQNEAENDIGFAETAALAEVLEARYLEGELLREIVTISSSASVNFEIDETFVSLQFELVSSLEGLSTNEGQPIQANVSYFQFGGPTIDSASISLVPRSSLLAFGLAQLTDLNSMNVTVGAEPDKQEFLIYVPDFTEGLNMYHDTIDVTYNDEVLASFPVSFYADTRMNVSFLR